ncbi:flavin monoamine oxidase family protein [Sphingomonas sp. Leaf30]|uniref:flavin monoamine oxidase family protein n=1 Tax=Sphingomonas sp. Leaf30 TaxID=1736213 RepID=UPI0007001B3F|nr:NAD(P)/FAD-dependent oxidoreductase [Sphingomonas sp. Leaf30]KQN14620.1 FAD-dependent oxidoreductase [Sphingomonas sp. Leaf30]
MRTVVIGGGAAGIAAARTLHDAAQDVLMVEANDRLGGRAHSLSVDDLLSSERDKLDANVALAGSRLDAGCGWLHSARRNPWTGIAEASGFLVDRSDANWRTQWRDLGFSPADQASSSIAYQDWNARALAALDGPDCPLSDFVDAHDPWRPTIDAISGYANGANLSQVSLHDWAAYENAASDDNWTVKQGYGTLVTSHAAGLPIRLSTPVTRIDHGGRRIRLDTPSGMIDADHVIVCVPTTVLARSQIRFDPPLPDKHAAAADLPLGLADKVFLHVDRPEWPANAHLVGNPYAACTASHRLSPFGWPIVESFFGGDCAEMLEDGDAAAFAIDELVALLGSDWRRRFTPLVATRWRQEPWIGGSYSHARIGCAGQRAILAAPVDGRIFFAGEACHREDFSTAHGAYETGVAAARAIIGGGAAIA